MLTSFIILAVIRFGNWWMSKFWHSPQVIDWDWPLCQISTTAILHPMTSDSHLICSLPFDLVGPDRSNTPVIKVFGCWDIQAPTTTSRWRSLVEQMDAVIWKKRKILKEIEKKKLVMVDCCLAAIDVLLYHQYQRVSVQSHVKTSIWNADFQDQQTLPIWKTVVNGSYTLF